jgi:putative membrane protein
MMGQNCWWWGPGYFFRWPLGMILGLVFWALVIYGVFYLISNMAKRQSEGVRKEETPFEILKRRYAKGEIDAEEFARRKKDLES